MTTDQLFKEMLQEFFREFLELFYPDVAVRLDFEQVTFLDKETFTDLPEGRLREVDLAAQVFTRDGQPEIVLIHVEVQAQRRSDFPYRMWEYYSLLRLRHRIPVFPIAIYLSPGAGGLTTESYTEALFTRDILRFQFEVIGLPDLSFTEYVEQLNPLAPAFSVLMRPGSTGDALRKAMIQRQQVIMEQNEARRALLLTFIERSLPLNEEQAAEYRRLISQQEYETVRTVITPYEERGIQQGVQQGLQQGLQQGIRQSILTVLKARFGDAADRFRSGIEAITDPIELNALLVRASTAPSLESVGLPQ